VTVWSYFSLTCPICGKTGVFQNPSSIIPVLTCGPHYIDGKEMMVQINPLTREKIIETIAKEFEFEITTA
jgi:hypothetical protein